MLSCWLPTSSKLRLAHVAFVTLLPAHSELPWPPTSQTTTLLRTCGPRSRGSWTCPPCTSSRRSARATGQRRQSDLQQFCLASPVSCHRMWSLDSDMSHRDIFDHLHRDHWSYIGDTWGRDCPQDNHCFYHIYKESCQMRMVGTGRWYHKVHLSRGQLHWHQHSQWWQWMQGWERFYPFWLSNSLGLCRWVNCEHSFHYHNSTQTETETLGCWVGVVGCVNQSILWFYVINDVSGIIMVYFLPTLRLA